MQYHSNTEGSPLDALILSCSETVMAIARSFARSSDGRVDADDMYSIGMLEVCEAVAAGRGIHADNPVVYLCKAARYAMCEEWRRVHGWSIASLDAPLSDDSSLTLIDVLPAPTPDVSVRSRRRTRALNGALRRLVSSRQRASLRRRYGLPGYGMHTLKETARNLRTTLPTVDKASRRGLRKLANDERLCKVVGVEVER
jgi:RNA polymerase sigma factor (sigma-70 family)